METKTSRISRTMRVVGVQAALWVRPAWESDVDALLGAEAGELVLSQGVPAARMRRFQRVFRPIGGGAGGAPLLGREA